MVKKRKRGKLSSLYTTVISARAHFLFAITEKIFPGKMGLRLEPVQLSSTAVGCRADGGNLKCCVQKFWTSWQGILYLLHWETDERKINMYCENRHKIRRDLCDLQSDCSLMQTRGLSLFWSSTCEQNFAKTASPDLEVSRQLITQ